MAGSINKITIIGNLGGDPEIRSTKDNLQIASFSVATSENWIDKSSGERRDKTEWHRVVVFIPGLVGVIEKYLKKGMKVYIEGSMRYRQWTDDAGTKRTSSEVVLSGGGNSTFLMLDRHDGGSEFSGNNKNSNPVSKSPEGNIGNDSAGDDEIPF
ncbi:MAG: single-stranded DNA-binding protein [Alphaproteobacteria bacterium]|nr:single-stranded DNA-binding protein [Alphaproteobacteria bacterium]MBL0717730.1 single-stranded DNA-binding protein [Alphaproteobacteria bacterium]